MGDVAVLGAGAAGLLAASALSRLNIEYDLFDQRPITVRRPVRGLHYLHQDCDLGLPPIDIHTTVIGSQPGVSDEKAYAAKIGRDPLLGNSVGRYHDCVTAYPFPDAMRTLARRHADEIRQLTVGSGGVQQMLHHYRYVISTVPLWLAYPEAMCSTVPVQVTMSAPPAADLAGTTVHENQVVYNVAPESNWHRYSKVYGTEWCELVQGGDRTITKVVTTDFQQPDDEADRVILIGRYGRWQADYLAHQAYYDVLEQFRRIV